MQAEGPRCIVSDTVRAMNLIALCVLVGTLLFAADDLKKPLVIGSQGSFYIGGETKSSSTLNSATPATAEGDITVNQMYVQYQLPVSTQHVPIVMVHGCCLSSKTWETTPDGRMGWNEYFLRKNRPVYL